MTGHYNGYTPHQRGRIIPAFRKLSGKNSPFENGEICAICADPDRPPSEWHSEDYSEPFSFAPPESFPLCKACHSRLHKRFNAPPGEWELFCLHLQTGGYGREFVKRWSLSERMSLCDRIASGAIVSLALVRDRESGPYWWRNLTLDPESLHAPWARPRPLRPRPDEVAFRRAFDEIDLSKQQTAFLRAHANAPRRTATMRALSYSALGREDPKAANLLYGTLARNLTSLVEWEPDRRDDGSPIWMSLLAEGWWPPGREYEWVMVPSAVAAVRTMGDGQQRVPSHSGGLVLSITGDSAARSALGDV